MNKQPLEALFSAMYRNKYDFADFATGAIDQNYVCHLSTRYGKTRQVVSPNQKLKDYHDFLRLFLLDFLPVNESVVFSYRKGVSAYDAVIRHAASKHFFACDIANFFPNLKRPRIEQTLTAGAGKCPITDIDSWLSRILDFVCVDDALPMGFSTSPTISNAALVTFDNALQKHCDANGLIYTRYSDDIVISARDLSALRQIEKTIASFLIDSFGDEFVLHPTKSRMLHTGVKVKLLGMVLLPNGRVSVDASVKSEIEVMIYFFIHDREKFIKLSKANAPKAEGRLAGLLNYVNTVDQAYLEKLRKKFGAAVVDQFLHRSFS
ncbi:MAG: reverse transcriptase family protein [Cytophagales bacterium]|nr:reverse transcriptase family protein [Cytophagales bacterium]